MEKQILSFKKKLNTCAELGWQEHETTAFIMESLKDAPKRDGIGGNTGLLYKIGKGSQAILLRADIDALKTQGGVKHTCGHSSHTAALMGAYLLLKSHPELLPDDKAVYFLFQPAEETYPSGAKAFLDEATDILPDIGYAFAAHVRPRLPLGTAVLADTVLGRGDYMEIEIKGKMVHVKNTPDGIDALEAAAKLILFTKSLQRRFKKSIRISVGMAQGGLQPNTIADHALLKGDIRLRDDRYQKVIKELLAAKVAELEESIGVQVDFRYFDGYPALTNDAYLQKEFVSQLSSATLKPLKDNSMFTFGCEDFSFIAKRIPSLYTLIGTGDKTDTHQEDCTISDAGTLALHEYFQKIIEWWAKKS